ncbi:putative dipeptidyl-peptidase 5, partial [Smittium mucronatum]
MKFSFLFLLPSLASTVLADVFNPDPSSFPDWSKVSKFDPEIYVQLKRMSSPALSPNRKNVVYSQYQYNIGDDASGTNLRLVDLTKGFDSVMDLTDYIYKQGDSSPVWIDDSTIAFTAVRGSPASNIFTISTVDQKITQLTNFTNDVSGLVYSKEAGRIAFISKVYQGMGLDQSADERQRIADLPSSGVVFHKLFVRHWDEWIYQDRNQLFTIPVSNNNGVVKTTGDPVNIVASYTGEWGLEPDTYEFSPDGKNILYSAKIEGREEAWQTEAGVFWSPADGSSAPVRLNSNFKGAASSPACSPDGSSIVWLQMATPGYESDQNQVILYNIKSGSQTRLIPDFTRSPSSVSFSDDSASLILGINYNIDEALFKLDISSGTLTRMSGNGSFGFVSQVSEDSYLVTVNTLQYPTSLFMISCGSDQSYNTSQITFENKDVLDRLWFSPTYNFWFNGALNDSVQAMVLYPYGFDPECTYPVFYLIHGGPQS